MPLRILLIEDNPGDAHLIELKLLGIGGQDFVLEKADRLSAGMEKLQAGGFDAILLDMGLPDSQGIDTVRTIHRGFPRTPIIVLTGRDDDELAAQSIQEGAQDYLSKAVLPGGILARTLRHAIERNAIGRKLRESEELFNLITENAVDIINVYDRTGKRIFSSPSCERILGYGAREMAAMSPFDIIHPEDHGLFRESLGKGGVDRSGERVVYRVRHKDKSWRFIEATQRAIHDENGALEKMVIVGRDITERKALEAQFMQAQKMEAVGRLTGGIAHDFNNLLCVIIGYAEYLQEQMEDGHSLRSGVDLILDAGNRAASLTRQLLAFSRQQVLNSQVLDLNTIVRNIDKLLRRVIGEDIQLELKLDPRLGRVKADLSQVEQILMNLAVNARDAMPQGGRLVIQTGNIEMEGASVPHSHPVKPGPYVSLTVADDGIGMDAQTRERAFDPFFTTKELGKGTGLGLSTVYGVVKQSGGHVEIVSAPGAGTAIQILLPRITEVPAIVPAESESRHSLKSNATILIAEDEASIRNLVRNTLDPCGFNLLEAKDGAAALEISRNYRGTIEVLLTDIVMPGMGGRALARQLAIERPSIEVVYMTGYSGQSESEPWPEEEARIALTKPFSRKDLRLRISEALERCAAKV